MQRRCLMCNLWCYDRLEIPEHVWIEGKGTVDCVRVIQDVQLPSGNMVHASCLVSTRMYIGWADYKIETYRWRKKRKAQRRLEDFVC